MSEMSINPVSLDPSRAVQGATEQRKAMLRGAVNEFVGATFYGQMFAIARSNTSYQSYGFGGRGEQVFAAQLDMELARRAGRAGGNKLTEAIYDRLAQRI